MNNDEAHKLLEAGLEETFEAMASEAENLRHDPRLQHIEFDLRRDLWFMAKALERAEFFIEAGFLNMMRAGIRRQRQTLAKILRTTEPDSLEPFEDLEMDGRKKEYGTDPLDQRVKEMWRRNGLSGYGKKLEKEE